MVSNLRDNIFRISFKKEAQICLKKRNKKFKITFFFNLSLFQSFKIIKEKFTYIILSFLELEK